jgi:hypothetical protein
MIFQEFLKISGTITEFLGIFRKFRFSRVFRNFLKISRTTKFQEFRKKGISAIFRSF